MTANFVTIGDSGSSSDSVWLGLKLLRIKFRMSPGMAPENRGNLLSLSHALTG